MTRLGCIGLVLVGFAVTGCTAKASHALMVSGLVVATGGAVLPDEHTKLQPASVSVGLVMFAIGWVLHQSTDPAGGSAPSQRVYTGLEPLDASVALDQGEKLGIYRSLPADHALFTR